MNNSSIHRFGKWIIVNKWELILLVLLVGNTSFLSNKISNIQAEIAVINSNINLLSELPLAYSETPKGLKLVHANQGVSKRDLEFLSRFRGPLLPDLNAASKNKPEELIKTIKAIILKGYAKEKKYLQEWGTGLSEREALIAYTVLRTNGSIPTYEVRTRLPNDL